MSGDPSFLLDLQSLEEGIEAVQAEATQAWDLSAMEADEERSELWAEAAVKMEELADVYGRLLLRYSGTAEVEAEA